MKLNNVSFSYDGAPDVDRVSLEIQKGDFLGILGPNGSGKTTLLRLILGLVKPQKGEIFLFGKPISQFNEWTRVGYVPQKATQFDSRFPVTVEEVVFLGRVAKTGLFGGFKYKDKQAVTSALQVVGMEKYRHRCITDLSGGQQQRVFIAKALASEPELLILDEPTMGIDVKSEEDFYALLADLNKKQGLTLILVSHDVDAVVREVTTLVCINKKIVYCGTPVDFTKGNQWDELYGKGKRVISHRHKH